MVVVVTVIGSFVVAAGLTLALSWRSGARSADDLLVSSADRLATTMQERPLDAPSTSSNASPSPLSSPAADAPAGPEVIGDAPEASGSDGPRRVLQLEPDGIDEVVLALIARVRASHKDPIPTAAVVEETVDELVHDEALERVDRPAVDRPALRLSGTEVSLQPGQLSAFADLSNEERRRVIIRVLCLLVAEDDAVIDLVALERTEAERTTAAVRRWGGWPDDADESMALPSRSGRLTQLRR